MSQGLEWEWGRPRTGFQDLAQNSLAAIKYNHPACYFGGGGARRSGSAPPLLLKVGGSIREDSTTEFIEGLPALVVNVDICI